MRSTIILLITAAMAFLMLSASVRGSECCIVPDNGTGTANLPPEGCIYDNPDDMKHIIDGLPPGTTIDITEILWRFSNIMRNPGGSLGGEVEIFNAIDWMQMTGTGALAGYAHFVEMQVQCETHAGPRTPGEPIQSFPTDMFRLQGQLPPGDPDFDLLRITAGTAFGMPSPGHTTLTRQPDGNWQVDSFFDITYRIDFKGATGGPLSGRSGSTTGTIRMSTGQCTVQPSQNCYKVKHGNAGFKFGTPENPPIADRPNQVESAGSRVLRTRLVQRLG